MSVREKGIYLRVTDAEKELLVEAAKKERRTLAAFIRHRVGLQSGRGTDPLRPLVSNDWNEGGSEVPTAGSAFALQWAEIVAVAEAAGKIAGVELRFVVRDLVKVLTGDGSGPVTFEKIVGGTLAAELETAARAAGLDPVSIRRLLLRSFLARMEKAAKRNREG